MKRLEYWGVNTCNKDGVTYFVKYKNENEIIMSADEFVSEVLCSKATLPKWYKEEK